MKLHGRMLHSLLDSSLNFNLEDKLVFKRERLSRTGLVVVSWLKLVSWLRGEGNRFYITDCV